jgi:hypothetical protein
MGRRTLRQIAKLAVAILVIAVIVGGVFAYISYGPGTLQIQMTDPPSSWGPATQIYLNYSAIEVHRADAGNESGWFTVVDLSAEINLTRIIDFNQTIGSKSLQTGTYNLMRFNISEAKVTVANVNYTATVPSGRLQIAITKGGIRINAGQTSTLLIDLNIAVHGSIQSGFTIVPDIRAVPE